MVSFSYLANGILNLLWKIILISQNKNTFYKLPTSPTRLEMHVYGLLKIAYHILETLRQLDTSLSNFELCYFSALTIVWQFYDSFNT